MVRAGAARTGVAGCAIPAALLAAALASACGGSTASGPSPPGVAPIRVLTLTATAGFRHDSIPAARQTLADMAARSGRFSIVETENLADVTAGRLASTDVLMFALTTGELAFDDAQKSAIAAFVANGGGFIGIHSAADTLYGWPEYGRIVGAYFKDHPWTQQGTVNVEDPAHPIDAGLDGAFVILDEFYTFRENPRGAAHILLSLDPASVGAEGDVPLAWTQAISRGRSYYNALGHFESTWHDGRFQSQLLNAIAWAAGR